MPGPVPKPDSRRQRRNKRTDVVVGSIDQSLVVPAKPTGLLKKNKELWDRVWQSDVANAWSLDTDLPVVERLFTLYDERARAFRAFRKRRTVTGSQGQPVINPMFKAMGVIDAEIRQLEDRLGLSPKARAQLGIALAGAKKSLEDLINGDLDGEDEDPFEE